MATEDSGELERINKQIGELSSKFIDLVYLQGAHPLTGIIAMLDAIKTIACASPDPRGLEEVKEIVARTTQELMKMKFEDNREYRELIARPTN